jgi:hypothetical protein
MEDADFSSDAASGKRRSPKATSTRALMVLVGSDEDAERAELGYAARRQSFRPTGRRPIGELRHPVLYRMSSTLTPNRSA